MQRWWWSLSVLVLMAGGASAEDGSVSTTWTFEKGAKAPPYAAEATGPAAKRMPKPKLMQGKLYLLESWMKSTASVAFPAQTQTPTRTVDVSFSLIMNTGTEGAGFAWLPAAVHGTEGKAEAPKRWEAPSLPGTLGVGFDASNPPNRDPFSGSGNTYDRPQHEISLHWDRSRDRQEDDAEGLPRREAARRSA